MNVFMEGGSVLLSELSVVAMQVRMPNKREASKRPCRLVCAKMILQELCAVFGRL